MRTFRFFYSVEIKNKFNIINADGTIKTKTLNVNIIRSEIFKNIILKMYDSYDEFKNHNDYKYILKTLSRI